MLENLFALLTNSKRLPEELSYEQARDLLEEHTPTSRKKLAQRKDVKPEILYYLAGDDSAAVRLNVAANPATPFQAHEILVDDRDDDVRFEMARKISRLLPDLDQDEQSRLREATLHILEQLAQDQLPRVRQIVAEEIKHMDNLPHVIVKKLAMDLELIVCAPILEYSPLLNDDDLREIIATTKVEGAMTAISMRSSVSETVSDSIAATLDIPAVAALLANPNAQIREETLDHIIEHAATVNEWHEPIVMRPSLSVRTMRRIAGFVASSLVQTMIEHHSLGDKLGRELLKKVRKRIQKSPESDSEAETAAEAQKLFNSGLLNDAAITEAIDTSRTDFVIQATGLMAGIPKAAVVKMFEARNGRVITALAMKAGLGMRTALKLQRDCARVAPTDVVNAKDGIDFPFGVDEMERHLSYFLA